MTNGASDAGSLHFGPASSVAAHRETSQDRLRVRVFPDPVREQSLAPTWSLTRVEADGDRLTRVRNYFYTPDVLAEICAELQVPFRSNGYRYWKEA